jgi:hypothetical protein
MTRELSAHDVVKYLKDKVDNDSCGGVCMLYQKFDKQCSPCPFTDCMIDGHGYGTCGLRTIRSFVQKIADKEVASCTEDTLTGTQQDCIKSLLRRIQNLEANDKVQDGLIYQSDHQKIAELERNFKDLKTKLKGL